MVGFRLRLPIRCVTGSFCAATAVACLLFGVSPALAGWSAPLSISAAHDTISGLGLASGPSGDLAAWTFYDLQGKSTQIFGAPGARYAVAPVNGTFGSERSVPAERANGTLLNLGDDHTAQLILRRSGVNSFRPEVLLGGVDGTTSARLSVKGSAWAGRAGLAGNSRGELLLAWIGTSSSGRRQVWASVRPAGRRFSRPELISAAGNPQQVMAWISSPSHRTDRGGFAADMLVAFPTKQGRLIVRERRHLQGWRRAEDIGPAAVGSVNGIAAHIGRDGRTIVAWSHQQLSEGGPLGPGYTQVAVQPAGARSFLPAQTLERDPAAATPGEPVLLADNGRGFQLAFIAQPGRPVAGLFPSFVRVSYSSGNRFGAVRTISAPGQIVSGLRGGEGPFDDLLLWSASSTAAGIVLPSGPAVYSASNPTSLHFDAPLQVSPGERAEDATAVFSPARGGWLAAWSGRPAYRSPLDPGPAQVRLAFCPETCR